MSRISIASSEGLAVFDAKHASYVCHRRNPNYIFITYKSARSNTRVFSGFFSTFILFFQQIYINIINIRLLFFFFQQIYINIININIYINIQYY